MAQGSFGAHQARNSATKDRSGPTELAWLTWFGAPVRDWLSRSNPPEGSWWADTLSPGHQPGASSLWAAAGPLRGRPPAKEVGRAPFLLVTLPSATPGLYGRGLGGVEGEGH